MASFSSEPNDQRFCRLIEVDLIDYQAAWDWQRELVAQRSAGQIDDTLLLLQHPPTITLGRAAKREHVLVAPEELVRRGVALIESDRGGDATYHAPGQIVGYPILKLSRYGGDILKYIRNVEEVVMRVLMRYDLVGERIKGLTGVWVGDEKVAAIGVRVSASGVSSHGFALNVSTDLRGFAQIVPCGITDRGVTSLEKLLGTAPPLTTVTDDVIASFEEVFDCTIVPNNEQLSSTSKQIKDMVNYPC
jgi:lipoyl(octanoyl) transferase